MLGGTRSIKHEYLVRMNGRKLAERTRRQVNSSLQTTATMSVIIILLLKMNVSEVTELQVYDIKGIESLRCS